MAKIRKQRTLQEKQQLTRKIAKGRGWILAVCLLTIVGGVYQYGAGQSEVEKSIIATEGVLRISDDENRAEFRENFRRQTGMTWDEAVQRARSELQLLLVVHLVLAATFFGLYIWAGANPFAASMVALVIYITVIAVGAIVDPTSIVKGLLIKILAVIALAAAVSAAYRYRRLYQKPAG